MSKAKKQSKGNIILEIDKSLDKKYADMLEEIQYMQADIDRAERKAKKKAWQTQMIHEYEMGAKSPELQEKYFNIILFETERLTKLTQGILDLNRFGHRGTMLDLADFDIKRMIKTTILTFEGTCSKKGLSFDLVLTGQELFVTADMSKIQQVLYNLIDNATKFSHPNNSIKIETSMKNEKALISVKDYGIGIPADSIKKIWERFYKTDLSRGRDKRGTGLGLAIVREIIQAHKEHINVISTEGVGTEFLFTLPLAQKEVQS